jgi:ferric-chelate reductase
MFRVTWAGVTGHWCDILIGLVFLPVSRNNVISTAFGVQASTLLLAHKVLAYTLCAFGLIHGLLYYVRKISLHLHVLVPY